MTWVNLNDVYVNKTGGTITGDLAVNGNLTINDATGNGTTYNVANEISTLRDSVSPTYTLMTEGTDGFCTYTKCGNMVCVSCDSLSCTANTSRILGTLPVGFRPKKSALGMAYVRGIDHCGQISVDKDGTVGIWSTISNSGFFGGCVTYPVA